MITPVFGNRPAAPLLPRHLRLRTNDAHEAASASNRLMSPHVLKPAAGRPFGWILHTARIGQSTLIYHRYRGAVEITASAPSDHVALQVVLRGSVDVWSDLGAVRLARAGAACVVSPTDRFRMRFAPGTHQLVASIPIPALDRAFGRLTGESGGDVAFRLPASPDAPWLSTLRLVVSTVGRIDAGTEPPPRLGDELERMLISSLLVSQPHSATESVLRPATSRAPNAVTAIAERVRSAPNEAFDFAELAGSHGISLRTLQDGFRHRYGRSPSAFQRDARLDMAHALLTEGPATSVTEVALASGFTHLGRFARYYRLRFGASPSTTLSRARTKAPSPN